MTPTPQEHLSGQIECEANPLDGERIVISGMSGLYAQSHNIKELSDILYNKVNPITPKNARWNCNHPEVAPYSGKTPDMNRFDAQFFMVHNVLGNNMDAMARKALEHTYQAIFDAGVSPAHLNGKKVAVYIGSSYSESERTTFYECNVTTGLGLTGCSRTMFANRISYWLNLKGPSLAIDESCCSSSAALEQAYLAIQRGECEAAIVGGCSSNLLPHVSIHYKRMIDMSKDDKTKSFDQNAEGCVNSDAINIVFLQKAKNALRVYAEIVHIKTEFRGLEKGDTGPLFGFRRNPSNVSDFIQHFYKVAGVSPYAVEYVEALGSATPEADKSELQAIENVFTNNRTDTLLVGSVTSNIGFTQAASGLSAVTKVLLAYHNGVIAANLHCNTPRQDVVALRDRRMRIVTEHQPFNRSYVAINNMSVTGVNSHMLFYGQYKQKDLSKYKTNIPRLVAVSGRQESGVTKIIEDLKSRPIDAEQIALLHNVHSTNITGHLARGYVILDSTDQETVCLAEKAAYFDDARRPLWFVYSGMGSQWAGMGAQLMRIPIFAAAIERCQRVLAPKGLNLVHIITSPDKDIFENILHSFVGIAAVQIGLTDILRELGLKPDGIIGHSVGELACAYADGCLTAEEMIMSAYSRGRVSLETKLIRGSMAAVGLGYKEVSKLCPPEIFVACHNGPASSTISGPAEAMKGFVAELTAKGIFAREVPCSNIAYHSQYIADAGPGLLKYLKELIKDPKPRSTRWVSTSVPQNKWEEPAAKYCSAEYLTNNLLSPVLFEETSRLIPNNAVCVEVAPHGLLQAILKRSLSADCRHVPLTKRGHPDNALHLLQAVGNLYTEGYCPAIQVLYPKVQFPVSTGTPMLSHLVEWIHIEKWNVPSYSAGSKIITPSCKFVISVHDEEHSYLSGHVIQGKTLYPAAALLVAVWDTFAMFSGGERRQGSVQFRDVHLLSQPTLHDQRPLRLSVELHRGNGRFEILEGLRKIATGFIVSQLASIKRDPAEIYNPDKNALQTQDVYQLLGERDYAYSDDFQSIACASFSLDEAALMWRDNWVTFLDGLLQLNMLRQPHDGVTLPTYIRSLDIDVNKHVDTDTFNVFGKERLMKANVFDVDDCTRCGGVSVSGITFKNWPVRKQNEFQFDSIVFPTLQLPTSTQKSTKTAELTELSLQITQPGDLSTLFWAESPASEVSELTVKVHYAGLNITDASKATDTGVTNNDFGMDFSGTLPSGARVMGLVRGGAAASVVRAQPELLWPVPAHWSLEDAATVPLAYAHALYCLRIRAQIREGMNVLIHGGTGALGQAAISIALALNCQVFTTVSDVRKKQFLKTLYPQLKDDFIGNSRDETFANMVLSKTNRKGCQIVLSCVKSEFKNDTIKCCHLMGITLDTVQIKYRENYYLGMYSLEQDKTYSAVDFSSIFGQQNYEERKVLQTMLSEGISRGYVRPLSRVSYAPHDAAHAFRLLAASRHRGKVLLKMQYETLQAHHRVHCSPETSNLIFCDEQPLGMQLADRLVSRGANKLYLVCTNITPYHWFKISAWRKQGVTVNLVMGSLNEKNAVNETLKDALSLGSLEGIYVVLPTIENHQINTLTNIVDSLDSTSRSLCSSLKYFAVVTSNTIIGQKTCQSRAEANLPSTMLDLSTLTNIQSSFIYRDVIDALESALCNSHAVLLRVKAQPQTSGLLQQLETLTGTSLSNKDDNTNLQELDLTNDKIQEILTLLHDTYNINIEEKEISQLTVAKIKELNEITSGDFKELKGLGTFFSYVDHDEQLGTTDVVLLSTLAQEITADDEYEVSQKYMCIVPGMEGHHERFRALCERLKLPALVLQPGLDRSTETVRETAQRYVKILLKKIQIRDDFNILGYESGIFVALEVAAILEDLGFTGTVFCVGYAPEELPAVIEDQLSNYNTKEELQDAVLRHMFTLMAGKDLTELERALHDKMTWEDKLATSIGVLLSRVSHSAHYIRGLIGSALASIERSRGCVAPTRALRSRLILLRAASHVPAAVDVLQRYSQQPITVHQLSAPLANLTNDMRVTSLINKHLSTDILQQFDKVNLCNSYFVNTNTFSYSADD